jgi:hypothetical protein
MKHVIHDFFSTSVRTERDFNRIIHQLPDYRYLIRSYAKLKLKVNADYQLYVE